MNRYIPVARIGCCLVWITVCARCLNGPSFADETKAESQLPARPVASTKVDEDTLEKPAQNAESAQDENGKDEETREEGGKKEGTRPPLRKLSPPKNMKRLFPEGKGEVWIDAKKKYVVVDGTVVLREGPLEMFACPKGSKEHESIVAIDAKAYMVHAALLATGAKPGKPVQYDPEYAPASGPEIEISVLWIDEDGKKHRARAQDWVRYSKTGDRMPFSWVFGGSSFWVDPETGENHYQAEAGDLICLSNFTTATMDVPIQSSEAAAEILFTAFTEKIPPRGTSVRVVLRPLLKRAAEADAKKEAQPAPDPTPST